ncbi:hypothetical protein ACFC4G_42615 [Streptomyces sp. NPDC056002]|uniref:hypothetical protein n=1 Tax=Streptomyces sp. NPDC056002 TaxID=3345675 RepID=UPI0035DBABB7
MNGWWSTRVTAERQYQSWIGSYGSMPGARFTLVEQGADTAWIELRAWPDTKA